MTTQLLEIFNSLSGEVSSYHQGCLATFVRFAGCNLHCAYCFGIRSGRRIPRLVMADKSNKKLNDVVVGDKLITFDSSMKLVETTVTKTIEREVNIWYRLKIDGKLYFVTPEHPFFTNRGLIKTQDLQIGDQILHSNYKDKISFSKLGSRNPMKQKEVAKKSAQNTDYVKMGKKVSKTIKLKKEQGLYTPVWDLLTQKQREKLKKEAALRQLGSGNSNWQGGKCPNYNFLKTEIKNRKILLCSNPCCGSSKFLEVHHIDGIIGNDDLNNLEILCKSCHSKIHKKGYNFWNKQQENLNPSAQVEMKNRLKCIGRNGMEVQEIKYFDRSTFCKTLKPKPLKVYNVSCKPYNSYLIDYMWVHNCDTPTAHDKGTTWNLDALVNEIAVYYKDTGHLCITGGEPLLHMDAVETIVTQYRQCWIETNGTIDFTFLIGKAGIVTDFKLEQIQGIPTYFYKLKSTDFVKFVIGSKQQFQDASNIQRILQIGGCKATFAYSAIFDYFNYQKLVKLLLNYALPKTIINTQIHKYLGLK